MEWLTILLLSYLASPAVAAAAAKNLADYSSAAVSLFGNMRTPAALIGGALINLGILSAPPINKSDSKSIRLMKRGNMILAVASLLSEILAVTYSSIAINKLAEVKSPKTTCVEELITRNYELSWVGTNVHFLAGLVGFALIVGARVYSKYGNPTGRIAICWSVAAFLQALSVINNGIAMGSGSEDDESTRFASNIFTLALRYMSLVVTNAFGGGICAIGSLLFACAASYLTFITLVLNPDGEEELTKED